MPVTVSTPPSTAPACLLFLSSDMTKIPKVEAASTLPMVTSARGRRLPHWMAKIRRPRSSSTLICTVTVSPTARNLPPRMVACVVGVVKRRGRVPCSSSRRIVWAQEVPV